MHRVVKTSFALRCFVCCLACHTSVWKKAHVPRLVQCQHQVGQMLANSVCTRTLCKWVQVGLDSKAVGEAWQAINKKHPSLPVAIFTSDASTWCPPVVLHARYLALSLQAVWVFDFSTLGCHRVMMDG